MSAHVHCAEGLVEKLKGIDTMMEDSLAFGILVAFINVAELLPFEQLIKKFLSDKIKWENVATNLSIDAKLLSSNSGAGARANAALSSCKICNETNYWTDQCFLNQMSHISKLNVSPKSFSDIVEGMSN